MLELILSGAMYVLQAGVLVLAAQKLFELLKNKVDDGDPNNDTLAEKVVAQVETIGTNLIGQLEDKLEEMVQKKIDETKTDK